MAEAHQRHQFANIHPSIRGKIVGMHLAGMDPNAIQQQIGCNIKTVRLWIDKYEEGGDDALCDHRKNNKRPLKSTPEEDVQLCEAVEQQPFTTIQAALDRTNIDISISTARRRLRDVGLTAHRPEKKTPLEPAHREERLRFAREHLDWTPEQWGAVIWSDEKVFRSSDDGRRHVYRPRAKVFRLDERYVVKTQWSGRLAAGFWGCMSADGVMDICEIPPRMNSENYVAILEHVMLPAARARFPVERYPTITFMHDNSSVHSSRQTRAWFQEHPDIRLLQWPSKSTDMNPIENLWGIMVRQWRSGQDRTRDALVAHVYRVWADLELINQQLTTDLVNSMANRMQCIIDNNGSWIPY